MIASFGMQPVFVGWVAIDTPATGGVITPWLSSLSWIRAAISGATRRWRISMSVVQRLCDRAMILAVIIWRDAIGAAKEGKAGVATKAERVLRKKRRFIQDRWG